MSPKSTLKLLKEIAVSSISTTEDINDTTHVIVDYRVGIWLFNVKEQCYEDFAVLGQFRAKIINLRLNHK